MYRNCTFTCTAHLQVVVREVASSQMVHEFQNEGAVNALVWSPDGTMLASSNGKQLVVRQAESGESREPVGLLHAAC